MIISYATFLAHQIFVVIFEKYINHSLNDYKTGIRQYSFWNGGHP